MADAPDTPSPRGGIKRLIALVGIGIAVLAVVAAGLTVLVTRVEKVHVLWCKRVGVLCAKEPDKPAVIVAPGGCPDFRMRGAMQSREPDEPAWDMLADVNGKISLHQGQATASGTSNVTCFGNQFLATFEDMSHGVNYQCVGSIDGKTFSGVCTLTHDGPEDVSGEFTN